MTLNRYKTLPKNMKVTLKNIREIRGFKQEEAAKLIGVDADTLRNYEQGKTYPDIPVLRKIESVYKVSYSQIIFLPLDFGLTEQKTK
jgi:transcriptional regulator with XRE-family HTH domain